MITCDDVLTIIKSNIKSISIDVSILKYDQSLRAQGIDSLDISLLIFAVEETYAIKIPTNKIGDLLSINDFQTYINAEIEKKKAIVL